MSQLNLCPTCSRILIKTDLQIQDELFFMDNFGRIYVKAWYAVLDITGVRCEDCSRAQRQSPLEALSRETYCKLGKFFEDLYDCQYRTTSIRKGVGEKYNAVRADKLVPKPKAVKPKKKKLWTTFGEDKVRLSIKPINLEEKS